MSRSRIAGEFSERALTAARIAASNFGWTSKDLTGTGTRGGAVSDLSTDKPLAIGAAPVATADVITTVGATLSLALPAGVGEDGGNYSATLTLTLV